MRSDQSGPPVVSGFFELTGELHQIFKEQYGAYLGKYAGVLINEMSGEPLLCIFDASIYSVTVPYGVWYTVYADGSIVVYALTSVPYSPYGTPFLSISLLALQMEGPGCLRSYVSYPSVSMKPYVVKLTEQNWFPPSAIRSETDRKVWNAVSPIAESAYRAWKQSMAQNALTPLEPPPAPL